MDYNDSNQNQHLQQQSLKLDALMDSFVDEYKPLLLCLVERQAAGRLRSWAVESNDAVISTVMNTCAEQKEEVARRIEALFPDGRDIEEQICIEVPEVIKLSQQLFEHDNFEARLAMQLSGDRFNIKALRGMADAEHREQARQALLTCAVLEQKNADCLENIMRSH